MRILLGDYLLNHYITTISTMRDDDDLLELHDEQFENKQETYWQDVRENNNDWAYMGLAFIILICIGIKFYQSINSTEDQQMQILLRQSELLNVIKGTQNPDVQRAAISEYDSLSQIMERLEEEEL